MDRFMIFVMYALWTLTLIGILIITFTRFQFIDLNVFVGILALVTIINSYFAIKKNQRNSL